MTAEMSINKRIRVSWDKTKQMVRNVCNLTTISYITWIEPLEFLHYKDGVVYVFVPNKNSHALEYVQARYVNYFVDAIASAAQLDGLIAELSVEFTLDPIIGDSAKVQVPFCYKDGKNKKCIGNICILSDDDPMEMEIEANGWIFHTVVGSFYRRYFICIPKWNIGCELVGLDDIHLNEERLLKTTALDSDKVKVVANGIKEAAKYSMCLLK